MKMRTYVLLLMVLPAGLWGQTHTISAAEYFWDTDPGQGSGTAFTAVDGNFNQIIEAATMQATISGGLSVGVHKFNVRMRNNLNAWGPLFTTVIEINEPTTALREIKVAAAEYFWDTDPGQGSGIPMLAFDGNFNQAIEQAVMQTTISGALSVGNHKFNVRVRDAENAWSPVFSVVIEIDQPTTALREIKVTAAEYFWDTDPGQGAGTPMLAFDGNFNQAIEQATMQTAISSALSVGNHILNYRVRDAENAWSPLFRVVVTINEPTTALRQIYVASAEYWFDADPGPGNGTPMLALDGNFNSVIEALKGGEIPSPVTAGIHVLWMRAKEPQGAWGPAFGIVVNMDMDIGTFNTQISGPTLLCGGAAQLNVAYNCVAAANSTYTWTIVGGTILSGQGTTGIIVNWNTGGVHTLTLEQCVGGNCQTDQIEVTLDAPTNQTQNITICQGQTFFAAGANQSQGGTYVDNLMSAAGCPFTLTTTLNVTPATTSTVNVSICQGETYFAGGANQNQSGTYTDQSFNNGCLHITTTILTVYPTYNQTIPVSICQGQSYFAGGSNQTQAGFYTDVYESQFGCDSVVVTNLSISPNINTNQSISICQGQSFFAGGANQTTSGTYVDVINTGGCNETLTTILTVNPIPNQTQNVSICAGQSYFAGGSNQTQSGTYVDPLTINGCTGTMTTNLTVLPPVNNTQNITICSGQSFFAGGANQTQSGTYTDNITNNGCLQILTTILTVTPPVQTTQNITICQGQSFFAGGANQTQSGTYTDNITNNGCTQVLTTILTVTPAPNTNVSANICQGEVYFAGGANQSQSGTYTDQTTNTQGCLQITTTQLTVHPNYNLTVPVAICQGSSYFAGGAPQTQPGLYTDVYQSQFGCDSVVVTNLTTTAGFQTNASATICQGQSILLGGALQTQPGVYTDLYQAAGGCDSLVTTTLNVLAPQTFAASAGICQGESILLGGALQNQAGIYTDLFTNAAGCDSIVVTTLAVHPNFNQNVSTSICQGDSLFVGGAFQSSPGLYTDLFESQFGCDSLVVTTLNILLPPPAPVLEIISTTQVQSLTTGTQYEWTIAAAGCPTHTFTSFSPTASINDHLAATGCSSGVYTFTVAYFNGTCWSVQSSELLFDTGIVENGALGPLWVYPNPAAHQLNIGGMAPGQPAHISITNVVGQEVISERGTGPMQLDVSRLASGTYYLRVETDERTEVLRFVKAW